jgi:predicted deacetylase
MSWFVVSVHDVSPATFMASRWWVRELEQRGVAATLLVIPGPFRGRRLEPTSATAGWLRERAAAGHEIAQHGWEHQGVGPVRSPSSVAARVVSRGCAEFAGLSNKEARRRILSGFGVLSSCDLVPWGFVPPAGLASTGTIEALGALGYRYVSTTLAVIDLWTKRRMRCVSRCHPRVRRDRPSAERSCVVPLRPPQRAGPCAWRSIPRTSSGVDCGAMR